MPSSEQLPRALPMLRFRRTKIIATLGPASEQPAVISDLLAVGVNVFRLNLSHGDAQWHADMVARIRACCQEADRQVAILADLCGPKIRVGKLPGGALELVQGSRVTVTTRGGKLPPGTIPSQYRNLHRDVSPGTRLLLDDGQLELRVLAVRERDIDCEVVRGGLLRDNKGMNLPGVSVSASALTAKDRADARRMAALGVDFLGLSFARRARDVSALRRLLADHPRPPAIIAKLENQEALNNAAAIIQAADAIMIARGDLGVELPPEQVPVAQDQLAIMARQLHKPAIVATQMLESMTRAARPTRAEAGDIAHAVRSGVDAVMLSEETAAGAFPLAAVQMMDRIARYSEAALWDQGAFVALYREEEQPPPLPLHIAVARSVAQLSRDLKVRGILVISAHGTSAAIVSSARPAAPVLAISANVATCRRMQLNWGIVPMVAETEALEQANHLAIEIGRATFDTNPGDHLLLLRGFSLDPAANQPQINVLPL